MLCFFSFFNHVAELGNLIRRQYASAPACDESSRSGSGYKLSRDSRLRKFAHAKRGLDAGLNLLFAIGHSSVFMLYYRFCQHGQDGGVFNIHLDVGGNAQRLCNCIHICVGVVFFGRRPLVDNAANRVYAL